MSWKDRFTLVVLYVAGLIVLGISIGIVTGMEFAYSTLATVAYSVSGVAILYLAPQNIKRRKNEI